MQRKSRKGGQRGGLPADVAVIMGEANMLYADSKFEEAHTFRAPVGYARASERRSEWKVTRQRKKKRALVLS
jgi:hypothetical protein